MSDLLLLYLYQEIGNDTDNGTDTVSKYFRFQCVSKKEIVN